MGVSYILFLYIIFLASQRAVASPLKRQHGAATPNIVFIKTPKTGGSTTGGVLRRIGAANGLSGITDRKWIHREPGIWANHNPYSSMRTKINKLKQPKVLCTMIRKPIAQALSNFYYANNDNDFSDKNIIKSLGHREANHIANYMGVRRDDIFYDWIGITERYDESLVMLKHVMATRNMNVTFGDLLYLKTKDSSNHTLRKREDIIPNKPIEEQSKKVQIFVETYFNQKHALEIELFQKLNEKLDNFIAMTPEFGTELAYFSFHLHQAQALCAQYGSGQGHPDCYWADNGCAVNCFNNYAAANMTYQR